MKQYLCSLMVGLTLTAECEQTTPIIPPNNVILLTVDGVRFQEILKGVRFAHRARLPRGMELLPNLKSLVLHDRAIEFSNMKIGNRVAMSLPGYRSILTGDFERACRSNNCPLIDRKTIFDDLFDLGIAQHKLATFASWDMLAATTESNPERIISSIGPVSFHDRNTTPEEDAYLKRINDAVASDRPPWKGSRYDKYTFALSLYYLRKYRPRLMYIQLVDSDEYAHEKKYKMYLKSIQELDKRVEQLLKTLAHLGEYGKRTSIVITTDHGRGRGPFWSGHSKEYLSAKRVWAYVLGAQKFLNHDTAQFKKNKGSNFPRHYQYSHIDIRPTIEFLLGIKCEQCSNKPGHSLVTLMN